MSIVSSTNEASSTTWIEYTIFFTTARFNIRNIKQKWEFFDDNMDQNVTTLTITLIETMNFLTLIGIEM